jgi:hypothetical protein
MTPTISQGIRYEQGSTLNIRGVYPTFLDFMTAYFQFLELDDGVVDGIMTVLQDRDIDLTDDSLLVYFQKEFLYDVPTDVLADKRKLIKHIKDFYQARGSEKSYRFLFRILFNETVDFYYPKTDLLKASDGKWTVDTIIRTTTVNNTSLFIARPIRGLSSGATANVENVVTFLSGSSVISEIYLSTLVGEFIIGETVEVILPDTTVAHETTYGLATGITITNPGTGYQQDDLITISGGNTTALFAVDVTVGQDTGVVQNATQANFPTPATIKLAPNASDTPNFYVNMQVEITDGLGFGQFKKITQYNAANKVCILEGSWNVVPDITSRYRIALGEIITTKVKDFGVGYSSIVAASFTQSGNGNATGNITVGAVGRYAGRYANDDGWLSWSKKLQDSFYWQDFSYALKSNIGIDVYRNVINRLLHPAGLALFGAVNIEALNTGRRQHIPSSEVNQSVFDGTPAVEDLQVQYQMLVDGTDTEKLFDISGAYPDGFNAFLGSFEAVEPNEPTFSSVGMTFKNNFVNASVIPVDLTAQTIIVVAKPSSLSVSGGLLGCIDTNNDTGISGFQISVNPDGSISYRVQKVTASAQNNLVVSYPAAAVNTSQYFFASLRYGNDTLTANLDQLPPITTTYGVDVEGIGGILTNTRGYYIGAGGFEPPCYMSSLFHGGLFGSTLTGKVGTIPSVSPDEPGYFDGIIAYVFIYNRYLQDEEIDNTFQFLKTELLTRGITLV